MRAYLFPIEEALWQFPLFAVALTVPYVLYSYWRYGAVSVLRSLVLFSFFFYMLCAYYLVILPLPDPAEVSKGTPPAMQLKPLQFLRDFIKHTKLDIHDPATYVPAIKQGWFFQPAFNVLLTLPFGVYMAYYFHRRFFQTLLLTFCLSLFFELTQLTGLYGLYAAPYRTFDVDDLLLNTIGGAIGHFIGIHVKILPDKEMMDESSLRRSRKVGYTRRAVALVVDLVVVEVLVVGLGAIGLPELWSQLLVVYMAYFGLLAALLGGRTLGKMFVHVRVVSTRARQPLLLALLFRYGILYALVALGIRGISLMGNAAARGQGALAIGVAAVAALALFADWMIGFFTGKRLLYERISGTREISYLHVKNNNQQKD